jgi:hypothetical protein
MKHEITHADIMPLAEYIKVRRERRQAVTELKKHRRVEVGPFATFYFENWATMWHQIHEMLYIEKGGDEQVEDELRAYNPLIPQGDELVATVMFEIDDERRRKTTLERLGGIEHHIFLSFAGETVRGRADADRENTRADDGKASSVQFVHFDLAPEQKAKFRAAGTQVVIGFDHANYGHMAVMPEPVRAALAQDLA